MGPEGYRQPMRSHDMSNENHNTIWFSCKFLEINGECGSGTQARNCHAMIMAHKPCEVEVEGNAGISWTHGSSNAIFSNIWKENTVHTTFCAHSFFHWYIFYTGQKCYLDKLVLHTRPVHKQANLFRNTNGFVEGRHLRWLTHTFFSHRHSFVFRTKRILHTANFAQTQAGSLHGHPVTRQEWDLKITMQEQECNCDLHGGTKMFRRNQLHKAKAAT